MSVPEQTTDETAAVPDPLVAQLAAAFTTEGLDEATAWTAARAAVPVMDAHVARGETCELTHTPPMDFAQCQTHDETFPLGGTCRFTGRQSWEVFAEEADTQRGRAVRLEHEVGYCYEDLAAALGDLDGNDPRAVALAGLRAALERSAAARRR